MRLAMMNIIRFPVAALAALIVLLGCESGVDIPKYPEITFGHLPMLGLNVARIEVVDEYQAPLQPPHVDHVFPIPPERALERWQKDRVVAKGASGVARYTIMDASATETALPTTGGVTGAFRKEPAERYEAKVSAKLEVFDEQGFRRAFATAQASLARGIIEGATLNEREELWFKLTEDLMQTFNAEFEKNIREHLGGYLM